MRIVTRSIIASDARSALANKGTVGRHDEVLCKWGDGSKATVIYMPEHSQIPSWSVVPNRLDLELIGIACLERAG